MAKNLWRIVDERNELVRDYVTDADTTEQVLKEMENEGWDTSTMTAKLLPGANELAEQLLSHMEYNPTDNLTRAEYNLFVALYDKVLNKASTVLTMLSQIDNKYRDVSCDHISNPESYELTLAGWSGCMGYYDYKSTTIPVKFLFDENWQEEAKRDIEERRRAEERRKQEDDKRRKEYEAQKERETYERLKAKFDR